jgi:hypothetical protein
MGNEGTIRVMNRRPLRTESYTAAPSPPNRAPEAIKARAAIHINGQQEYKERDGAINHFRNFIQSVLGKELVIARQPWDSRPSAATWPRSRSEPEEDRLG